MSRKNFIEILGICLKKGGIREISFRDQGAFRLAIKKILARGKSDSDGTYKYSFDKFVHRFLWFRMLH